MRKLIMILLVFTLFFIIFAKNEVRAADGIYSPNIDGFMGLKWGESQSSVKEKILSREESPEIQGNSEIPFILSISNIKSSDLNFDSCRFMTYSKGFYGADCQTTVTIDKENPLERHPMLYTIRNLLSAIIEKYGQPWSTGWKDYFQNYKYSALVLANMPMTAPNDLKHCNFYNWKSKNNSIIGLFARSSEKDLYVSLLYLNIDMAQEAHKEEKKWNAELKKEIQSLLESSRKEERERFKKDL